jgi:hypothetical protein
MILKFVLEYDEMKPWLTKSVSLKGQKVTPPHVGAMFSSLSIYLYIMYIKAIYWDIKLNLGLCFN